MRRNVSIEVNIPDNEADGTLRTLNALWRVQDA